MTDELVVVELLKLPLAVLTRAADHNHTLQRELALVHEADESGVAPARLLWLSHHLDEKYADFNSAPSTRREPDEPTATADMMRPPAARRIERNRLIVPIEVVYGASREVT